MQDKMTGSPSTPQYSQDVYDNVMEEIIARGGPKLVQYFKQQLAREEEEKRQALLAEQQKQQEELYKERLNQHYGNLKQAFDSDPEYADLLQQRKMNKDNFELIYDNLLEYQDKAPAMLKHLLRNENIINDLAKAPNEWDARYLLNNVFSDVNREAANQQAPAQTQGQNQAQPSDKPVKLPNPQLMPELPSSTNIDDEVQRIISRM